MSPETIPAGTPAEPAANSDAELQAIPPGLREKMKPLEREWLTYLRELPRLLSEGEAGRHALIRGDQVLSIWDTQADALQAGCERFGLEPICVKKIDPRDPERWAYLVAREKTKCPS
jgi:hypothetical protein